MVFNPAAGAFTKAFDEKTTSRLNRRAKNREVFMKFVDAASASGRTVDLAEYDALRTSLSNGNNFFTGTIPYGDALQAINDRANEEAAIVRDTEATEAIKREDEELKIFKGYAILAVDGDAKDFKATFVKNFPDQESADNAASRLGGYEALYENTRRDRLASIFTDPRVESLTQESDVAVIFSRQPPWIQDALRNYARSVVMKTDKASKTAAFAAANKPLDPNIVALLTQPGAKRDVILNNLVDNLVAEYALPDDAATRAALKNILLAKAEGAAALDAESNKEAFLKLLRSHPGFLAMQQEGRSPEDLIDFAKTLARSEGFDLGADSALLTELTRSLALTSDFYVDELANESISKALASVLRISPATMDKLAKAEGLNRQTIIGNVVSTIIGESRVTDTPENRVLIADAINSRLGISDTALQVKREESFARLLTTENMDPDLRLRITNRSSSVELAKYVVSLADSVGLSNVIESKVYKNFIRSVPELFRIFDKMEYVGKVAAIEAAQTKFYTELADKSSQFLMADVKSYAESDDILDNTIYRVANKLTIAGFISTDPARLMAFIRTEVTAALEESQDAAEVSFQVVKAAVAKLGLRTRDDFIANSVGSAVEQQLGLKPGTVFGAVGDAGVTDETLNDLNNSPGGINVLATLMAAAAPGSEEATAAGTDKNSLLANIDKTINAIKQNINEFDFRIVDVQNAKVLIDALVEAKKRVTALVATGGPPKPSEGFVDPPFSQEVVNDLTDRLKILEDGIPRAKSPSEVAAITQARDATLRKIEDAKVAVEQAEMAEAGSLTQRAATELSNFPQTFDRLSGESSYAFYFRIEDMISNAASAIITQSPHLAKYRTSIANGISAIIITGGGLGDYNGRPGNQNPFTQPIQP